MQTATEISDIQKLVQIYKTLKSLKERMIIENSFNQQQILVNKRKRENQSSELTKMDKKARKNHTLDYLASLLKCKIEEDQTTFADPKSACFAFRKLLKKVLKNNAFYSKNDKEVSINCSYRTISDTSVQIEVTCEPKLDDKEIETIRKSILQAGTQFFSDKCETSIRINVL